MKRILLMPLITFLFVLLNGCTTLPPKAPDVAQSWQKRKQWLAHVSAFKINGKIAVRSAHDSGSATVSWWQNHKTYQIALFGPLGAGNLKLIGKPGHVELIAADGKHYHAINAEDLLAQNWGFRLPVDSLYYWVRSLPAPRTPYHQTFDSYQRVKHLTQGAWQIEYLRYTHLGQADLPTLIRIVSPGLTAKLVIYQWQVG